MIRRLLYIILLTNSLLSAQNIKVTWHGDSLPQFQNSLDSNFSSKKDLLRKIERTQFEAFGKGYLCFSIDSLIEKDSANFNGYVNIGEQYTWQNIRLKTKGEVLPNYLKPRLSGKIVNTLQLSNYYISLIQFYQNNGFPFAQVHLDSIQLINNSFTGNINITPNHFFVFDTITVVGDSKIKSYYLQNYLNIIPDQKYDEKLFLSIEKKLKELPFVTTNAVPQVFFKNNKAQVKLNLSHKPANFINGVLGVLPNSNSKLNQGNENKMVITGDLKLSLGNVFQHGEKIKFNWKRIQTETQQLITGIEIPYLFRSLFGVTHDLDLLKQDTSYITFKNKIGVLYSITSKKNIKAFWENSGTNSLSENPIANNNLSSTNGSTNIYGIEFNWSSLDYKYNPRKGFQISLTAKSGIKKISGTAQNGKILIPLTTGEDISSSILAPQTSTIYEAQAELNLFIPIFKVTTIKLGTVSGWKENKYLLDNDLYRLGGFQMLRGFDEQSLFASIYSVNTFEYRILFEQNSHVAIFYDQGITAKRTLTENTIDFPFGFGVGVNFQTKPGIFSVSYATGRENNNPIDFGTAKIHFGFVNLF